MKRNTKCFFWEILAQIDGSFLAQNLLEFDF